MFKDKYKKDNDLIKPNPELIKKLNEKMSNSKKSNDYNKIRKKKQLIYGLIVTCVLIIIIPTLLFERKNNNNVVDNIENNYINDDTKASENTKIPEDQIYAYSTSMNSWAIDPENPEELIVDSAAVVKIKVISIGRAKFFDSLDRFKPLTPVKVEIIEVLSGENLSGEKTIYTDGGEILISEQIKHLPQQSEKMGLTKLEPEKQNSTYISYTSEYDYDFEIGNEYVVILYKQVNGIYTVIANGYGIFKQENQIYKNVITGKGFDFEK